MTSQWGGLFRYITQFYFNYVYVNHSIIVHDIIAHNAGDIFFGSIILLNHTCIPKVWISDLRTSSRCCVYMAAPNFWGPQGDLNDIDFKFWMIFGVPITWIFLRNLHGRFFFLRDMNKIAESSLVIVNFWKLRLWLGSPGFWRWNQV